MMKFAIFGLILFVSSAAKAFNFDGNIFYFADSFKISDTTTDGYSAYDIAANLDIDKRGMWSIGWMYMIASHARKDSTGQYAFSTADMGPKVSMYLSKSKQWGMSVAYLLIGTAKYKDPDDGTPKTWKGSSIKVDFGYTAIFGEWFHLGGRINYYSATYAEQIIEPDDYSKVAYTRGWIYPSLYFRAEF